RVDGFSKIMISTALAMPAGLSSSGTRLPAAFMAWPMSTMRRRVCASMESRSRKCRGAMPIMGAVMQSQPLGRLSGRLGEAGKHRVETGDCLGKLVCGNVERRQRAHHVVAGTDCQELLFDGRVDDLAHGRLELEAGQQAATAHLLDDAGVGILERRELLLEAE